MVTRLVSTAIGAALLAPALAALPAPQTGVGGVQSGAPPIEGIRALTPFEEFTGRLKLDEKTQVPAAREIFLAAAREAGPVGVEMLQLRQKLLNVELGNAQDAKVVEDAYTAAATKMIGIETAAFAKVYATLKPNQQSNAAQAFTLIAGIFQSPAPGAGGRGQRGGGRQ